MEWQKARNTSLQKFIHANRPGLITDVDGTISPIVDQPDQAQVTPENRRLLSALQEHLALVGVISGRSAQDVQERVNLPELLYVGNHGLERWQDGQSLAVPDAARYRPQLDSVSRAIAAHLEPGMFLEDKRVTLSLHYRLVANPAQTMTKLAPVLRGFASAHGLKMFEGRMVFEFRPPIQKDKGTAFRELVSEHGLDAAIYLGDDTTDIAALQAATEMRQAGQCYSLGVGVCSVGTPETVLANSDLWVSGVAGVESFLSWLLSSLRASST